MPSEMEEEEEEGVWHTTVYMYSIHFFCIVIMLDFSLKDIDAYTAFFKPWWKMQDLWNLLYAIAKSCKWGVVVVLK